jgi:hypothetical protein
LKDKKSEKEKNTMPAADILHPYRPEFEQFLYASVGEDRNGCVVTVLSTLARLNLDPWEEAAELAAAGREAARSRLGLLLSRFRDVPALGHDSGSVARDLALLLPERPTRSATRVGPSVAKRPLLPSGVIWAALSILLILAQMMFAGAPGSGE